MPTRTGVDTRVVARAKQGDREARERLVEENMGLVRSTAHRYRGMGVPLEDLVQEGVIGLLEAIDRYDATNGAAFSTYAFWRVRQSITRALTEHGRIVRLPKEIVERRRAISRATSAARAAGHEPTVAEVAEFTHLSDDDVREALAAPTSVGSLDEPFEDGTPLSAAIADPEASDPEARALAHEEELAVDQAVSHLRPRQREVVEAHFGLGREPRSLAQVGAALHVSAARARALERDALCELALELEPTLTRGAPRYSPPGERSLRAGQAGRRGAERRARSLGPHHQSPVRPRAAHDRLRPRLDARGGRVPLG